MRSRRSIAPSTRFSTLMLWRWAKGERVERTPVPISRIAESLRRAVIIAEDDKFCSHHGIDFGELRLVLKAEAAGGRRSAAARLAENLFLWPGRSYVRKALELPLALWIDLVIPKRRQMGIYLNVAQWGPSGEFGAEAAARRAFGKPASALSLGESAILAATCRAWCDRSRGR
jgi:monofunctional biosynthetic peptidoglycan transglycosylase